MPAASSPPLQRPSVQPGQHRSGRFAGWPALALALVLTLAAPLTQAASDGPALMRAVADQALDDPRAALDQARLRLSGAASSDAGAAFWLRLAQVEVLVQTDQEAASRS